ncbi:AAA family ATPase [Nocardioides sp. LHG3406-4]|uniref:AAA family ATPase n=1 Tax=Nocardioides sp. LHG3406-4 TaxID=2804575 RepID=UPI003CF7000A
MDFDQPPVVRVDTRPEDRPDARAWPMTIPAVRQVVEEGLDLRKGVTFLVGENGSGKSTLVEGIAVAYGLSPEGGSNQGIHSTRPSESTLSSALRLARGLGAAKWGFFLRAETMHGWYTFLEQNPGSSRRPEPVFHEMSHGESFLTVLASRFDSSGFYCLDEPEAALSFTSTLSLIGTLLDLVGRGGQVLCATHSPVLAALPGARILEVGEWGLRDAAWEDLAIVDHWRRFLTTPEAYLRHLVD